MGERIALKGRIKRLARSGQRVVTGPAGDNLHTRKDLGDDTREGQPHREHRGGEQGRIELSYALRHGQQGQTPAHGMADGDPWPWQARAVGG